ncbi:DUF47 domain-containing protein [Alsobacter sp. SYSU M60028]|uniref:DUF47 domain-containing protein n=1 Tax=Alsobacter ponti TaxID=2962936 RepID=A0ABT1LHI8_9HYPH|nr:DUF47 domain-containing protein [Alsobacter ponti]MCP8940924.1 DUF47 domain-containing protein [Alsobacter ponti]
MANWFRRLLPREDKFFDMFERHAQTLIAGSDALARLLEGGDDVPRWCKEIEKHEDAADHIASEVMVSVRRTFITPFDRGDIKDLIQSMDDAIDQMHQTAKAITLFDVRSFDPPMVEMAALAGEAARLTAEALPKMRNIGQNAGFIAAYAEKVTVLEGRADHLHDTGLRDLFVRHGKTDPMAFIVGTEIYSHLEKVVDRFEDIANEIHAIVIEHV